MFRGDRIAQLLCERISEPTIVIAPQPSDQRGGGKGRENEEEEVEEAATAAVAAATKRTTPRASSGFGSTAV